MMSHVGSEFGIKWLKNEESSSETVLNYACRTEGNVAWKY